MIILEIKFKMKSKKALTLIYIAVLIKMLILTNLEIYKFDLEAYQSKSEIYFKTINNYSHSYQFALVKLILTCTIALNYILNYK